MTRPTGSVERDQPGGIAVSTAGANRMTVRVERQELAEGSKRPFDARAANNRIAEKARRLQFLSRVPMMCECSTRGCQTLLLVGLHEYDQIRRGQQDFLTAPGHELDDAELHLTKAGYEILRLRRQGRRDGDRRSA